MNPPAPLIVSLALDDESFRLLDGLRTAHFPPERNFLNAHLTLFHHLPAEEQATVEQTLARVAGAYAPMPLRFEGVRFLGRGVAIGYESSSLLAAHRELVQAFRPWLTPQDQQKLRPHVTVQNKVAPDLAKALCVELKASFPGQPALGTGFTLWRYLSGPWERVAEFPFAGERAGK